MARDLPEHMQDLFQRSAEEQPPERQKAINLLKEYESIPKDDSVLE